MKNDIQLDPITKQQISLVLRYYRQKNNIKQCDFIQDQQQCICSADTYSRIENGKLIKRSSIYLALLQRLDMYYHMNVDIWEGYHKTFQHLLRQLYLYRIAKFRSTCMDAKHKLSKENDFLAQEICLLLDILLQFFIDNTPLSNVTYEKYCMLFPIFPSPLQVMLKYMLFVHVVSYQCDYKESKFVFEALQLSNEKHPLLQLAQAYEYMLEQRYLDCYRILSSLKLRFQKDKNHHLLIDVYDIELHLFRYVQKGNGIQQYEDEYFSFYQQHHASFHPFTYAKALYLKARILFYQKNYVVSALDFKELCTYSNTTYPLYASIFLYHCGVIPSSTTLYKNIYQKDEDGNVCLYRYYIYKHKHPHDFENLEQYFMKHVFTNIQQEDPILWPFVYDEIMYLIKQTKHYYIKKKL